MRGDWAVSQDYDEFTSRAEIAGECPRCGRGGLEYRRNVTWTHQLRIQCECGYELRSKLDPTDLKRRTRTEYETVVKRVKVLEYELDYLRSLPQFEEVNDD